MDCTIWVNLKVKLFAAFELWNQQIFLLEEVMTSMIWMEFLQVNNCSVLTAPIAIIAPLRKLLNLRNWTVFFIHVVVNGVICSIVQVIWTSVCNNAQSLLSAIIFRNKRFMLKNIGIEYLMSFYLKVKLLVLFWAMGFNGNPQASA